MKSLNEMEMNTMPRHELDYLTIECFIDENGKYRPGNSASLSRGKELRVKIQKSTYSLGHSIESMGKRLQKDGYDWIGTQVEKVGEMIENIGGQSEEIRTANVVSL